MHARQRPDEAGPTDVLRARFARRDPSKQHVLGAVCLLLAAALAAVARGSDVQAQVQLAEPTIVWIPEGAFVFGADGRDIDYAVQLCQDENELAFADECIPERFAHERAGSRVYLRRFGLDRTEVSRARYAQCVAAGVCRPSRVDDADADLGAPSFPVAGVDAHDAARYCAFRGGRLPSEEEWEKAARGADDGRRFPWGSVYDSALANHGRPVLRTDDSDGYRGLAPVGVLGGRSPYGLADMAGNVWEWTSSRLRPLDRGSSARPGDRDSRLVVRGGSYLHPAVAMRVTARTWLDEGSERADLGLRCAYDP
jgi:formylglycine-generating enzyme required for sulfatase activity